MILGCANAPNISFDFKKILQYENAVTRCQSAWSAFSHFNSRRPADVNIRKFSSTVGSAYTGLIEYEKALQKYTKMSGKPLLSYKSHGIFKTAKFLFVVLISSFYCINADINLSLYIGYYM